MTSLCLVGVALLCAARAELPVPLAPAEPAPVREGQQAEVVLQLKYDGGELDRIYLAQFRRAAWRPSVAARRTLCSDLCYAGLGGEGCGPRCAALVPVGLAQAADGANGSLLGEPRVAVCPALCENQLGYPLCGCEPAEAEEEEEVSWPAVCAAFCHADRYVLSGCPACEASSAEAGARVASRVLTTAEGWSAWCDVQCRQGHGGAACNCDRSPFL